MDYMHKGSKTVVLRKRLTIDVQACCSDEIIEGNSLINFYVIVVIIRDFEYCKADSISSTKRLLGDYV